MRRNKNKNTFYGALFDYASMTTHYFNRLQEITLSAPKWTGLPDTVDERFLEWCLFYDGMAVFFKDDVLGFLCLQTMPTGQFNVYRIPTTNRAYAVNGYQMQLDLSNSVIIYNNMIRTPSEFDTRIFAQKLAHIDVTININVNAQKTPVAILCDEKQKLTFENLYQQYDGARPFIFGDKSLDLNQITALQTRADYKAAELYELKTNYWNEALTYAGISNVQYQKKERINTDEVTRGMGGAFAMRRSKIKSRQQACEQINRMFNLDIWCDFPDEVDGVENADGITNQKEGGLDE